jgi:hypothetical protein
LAPASSGVIGSPAKDVGWRRKVENKSKKEKINRKGKK